MAEMQFDPSRRLFLRRAGLTAIAPAVMPLGLEKVVKYFFAPRKGWQGPAGRIDFLDIRHWFPVPPNPLNLHGRGKVTTYPIRVPLTFVENNTWPMLTLSSLSIAPNPVVWESPRSR